MNTRQQVAKSSRVFRPHVVVGDGTIKYVGSETRLSQKRRREETATSPVRKPNTTRPALVERNGRPAQTNSVNRLDADFTLDTPSSDGISSNPTTPGEDVFAKTLTTSASSIQSIRSHPALNPSRHSCSDSVICSEYLEDDEITVEDTSCHDTLAWESSLPFTGPGNAVLEDGGPDHGDLCSVPQLIADDGTENRYPDENGSYFAPRGQSASSEDSQLSPIEEIRRNVAELDGGDAVFSVQLDFVMEKLVYALTDLDSAYLFRDFAGHFTEFLDRFGPGGYDAHRAPATAGWIIGLLLPLIHADADATEARIRVYAEVSCWLQRVVKYLGYHNADLLLDRGAWQRCVEHMGCPRTEVAQIAFDTAEVIMRNVPLEYNLVLKVLFMQPPLDLNVDDVALCYFRLYRVRFLSVLLERIDQRCRTGKDEQYMRLVPEIVRALDKFRADETDIRVTKSIDVCLKYAYETQALFSSTTPSPLSPGTRRPHLSLTLTRWQQLQFAEPEEPKEAPKRHFFSKLFHWRSREKGVKAIDAEMAELQDAMSVNTVKSTRSLRQKWHQLFERRHSRVEGDDHEDADDALTVITI